MTKLYRMFALMIAIPIEVAILLWLSIEFGKTLNEKYPISYDWKNILLIITLLVTIKSFYLLIRYILKEEKNEIKE